MIRKDSYWRKWWFNFHYGSFLRLPDANSLAALIVSAGCKEAHQDVFFPKVSRFQLILKRVYTSRILLHGNVTNTALSVALLSHMIRWRHSWHKGGTARGSHCRHVLQRLSATFARYYGLARYWKRKQLCDSFLHLQNEAFTLCNQSAHPILAACCIEFDSAELFPASWTATKTSNTLTRQWHVIQRGTYVIKKNAYIPCCTAFIQQV